MWSHQANVYLAAFRWVQWIVVRVTVIRLFAFEMCQDHTSGSVSITSKVN